MNHTRIAGNIAYASAKHHSQKRTTRLAIAKRSRVSIRIPKNFGQAWSPCKNFPLISFQHHAKFGNTIIHTVCMHVWGPQKTGKAGAPPRWNRAWLTPINMPLPAMCDHYIFGRSRSNSAGVITEIRQKNMTLASYLSRLLEVTGTKTHRSSMTFH